RSAVGSFIVIAEFDVDQRTILGCGQPLADRWIHVRNLCIPGHLDRVLRSPYPCQRPYAIGLKAVPAKHQHALVRGFVCESCLAPRTTKTVLLGPVRPVPLPRLAYCGSRRGVVSDLAVLH